MSVSRSVKISADSAPMWVLLLAIPLAASLLLAFNTSGERRPRKHPEFSEGFRAFKQDEWKQAADRMLAALSVWPEDGELTRVYGRWFEPYLPRYYLGAALYELGCYELSLRQLDESLLNNEEIKGAKKQLEELESLKLKSDRLIRQGVNESDNAECVDWSLRIDQLKTEDVQ